MVSAQKKRYYLKNVDKIKRRRAETRLRDNETRRLWHHANKDKSVDYHLRANYGISKAEYDALLAEQGGVCAICRQECCTGRRLSVDHDHETGKVRGILCSNCNIGIGKFKENTDLLLAAINYLMADLRRRSVTTT